MDFNGNQTVQGPKHSFSANCSKGFKRFQTMNWKYCGNKDTDILDALEAYQNISKINFKVN